eukprot:1879934-Alexandrium_andersonii.AAC.1
MCGDLGGMAGKSVQIRVQSGDAGRLEPVLGGPSCSGGVSRDFALRGNPQKAPSDQKGKSRPRARGPQKHVTRASVHGSKAYPGGRFRRALG